MGMWDFDLGGKTIDEVEASAGPLQDGYYRFKFTEAADDKDSGSMVLKMQVTYGIFAGRVHAEYLRSPMMAENTKQKEFAIKHAGVYLKRFGLVPRGATAVNNPDWRRLVGMEGIMRIASRSYEAKDKITGQSQGMKNVTEVPIGGVWPLDHPEVAAFKPEIKAAVGLAPAPGGAAAGTTTPNGTAAPPTQTPPGAPGSPEAGKALAASLWS